MLHSMTGYGKTTGSFQNKKITLEVKSLNSKSIDLYVRQPSSYKDKEIELRRVVGDRLDRGKMEVILSVEQNGEEKSNLINKTLAKAYFNDIISLEKELGRTSNDILSLVLRMPDIYSNEREELSDEEWKFTLNLLEQALDAVENFRMQEGKSLENDFEKQIQAIGKLLAEVPKYEQERIITIRERMQKALDEKLGNQSDPSRFEQELIFYIEKLDVSEEKVRLSNHLDYFIETMKTGKAAGRKLGFITQEIGREINTLGSKSNHVEMQKLVVLMKDHLEKIKEQVLNTL
ncbi:MAG: YicC/YloC family endoribonuclease [Crocinitomicaceae bacterium]